jgi:hypothetical protein
MKKNKKSIKREREDSLEESATTEGRKRFHTYVAKPSYSIIADFFRKCAEKEEWIDIVYINKRDQQNIPMHIYKNTMLKSPEDLYYYFGGRGNSWVLCKKVREELAKAMKTIEDPHPILSNFKEYDTADESMKNALKTLKNWMTICLKDTPSRSPTSAMEILTLEPFEAR